MPSSSPSAQAPYPWQIDFFVMSAVWGASFLFLPVAGPEFGAIATAAMRVGIALIVCLMLLATYNDLWRILKNTGWFGSGS